MNARDRFFTLRLEPALRVLVKNSGAVGLAYLARRFAVGEDELRAWLDEWNHGSKVLTAERIEAVKRETGSIAEGKTEERPAAATAAKVAETTAPAAAPSEETPAPAAAAPASMRDAPKNAHNCIERPWETVARQFRPKVYIGWRPLLEQIAAGGDRLALCQAAKVTPQGLGEYCLGWLGARIGHTPETIREYLAWADARCAASGVAVKPILVETLATPAGATTSAVAAALDTVHGDGWAQWRADAIAALVAMGTKARQAELQVDAAIKRLAGADVDLGALVELALAEAPAPAPGRSVERPATSAAAAAGPAIAIGGELFRLELIVRLVPMSAAGSGVPS